MPRGRMLNKEISVSNKLPKVCVHARLLFTWMIPHLDVKGKIFGDSALIKGTVVPYLEDFTVKKIEKWLQELANVKLILIYGNERKYIYFPGFNIHQNVNELRESNSLIPDPTQEELQSLSNITPGEVKLSKVKLSKDKETYSEFVTMTKEEYEKLVGKYGENFTKLCIEKLNNYKGAKGRTYKSDYLAILNWVVEEISKKVNIINQHNFPQKISRDELLKLIDGKSSEEKNRIQNLYASDGNGYYTLKNNA